MTRPSEDDDLSMFFDTPYTHAWNWDPSKPVRGDLYPDAEASRLHETAFLGSFCADPYLLETNDLFNMSSAQQSFPAATSSSSTTPAPPTSSHSTVQRGPKVSRSSELVELRSGVVLKQEATDTPVPPPFLPSVPHADPKGRTPGQAGAQTSSFLATLGLYPGGDASPDLSHSELHYLHHQQNPQQNLHPDGAMLMASMSSTRKRHLPTPASSPERTTAQPPEKMPRHKSYPAPEDESQLLDALVSASHLSPSIHTATSLHDKSRNGLFYPGHSSSAVVSASSSPSPHHVHAVHPVVQAGSSLPPKLVLREEFNEDLLSTGPVDFELVLDRAIPKEIRTGTPTESRCFRISATLVGNWKKFHLSTCTARIRYHYPKTRTLDPLSQAPGSPNGDILAGETKVNITTEGLVKFNNLSLKEGSTRHRERLFCIELTLHSSAFPDFKFVRRTSGFYAFTHRKVLSRRSNIALRLLSQSFGCMEGGEEVLLVGCPFIKGPQFTIQFLTPHGAVLVKSARVEFISQTLISFPIPPYPNFMTVHRGEWPDGYEVQCSLLVSNDGKNFSPPIPFYFVVGPQLPPSIVKQRADMIERAHVVHRVQEQTN